MTPTCKWITDEAGPLACRKGQHGYSWSICASTTECPGQSPKVSRIRARAGGPTVGRMPGFPA
jgi:hypothetical protein